MLTNIELKQVLFLDIETVPLEYRYKDLKDPIKALWDKKWQFSKETDPAQQYVKAGIYAEFAKVICISVGYFEKKEFILQSFYGHNERQVLEDFSYFIQARTSKGVHLLCAHNGKEFDFPFLCRRLLINGLNLPKILDIAGKKPWDINHLDTMELWKFGDYKNYTSLNLLAAVFGIPTPKDEIDGSDVARVYYEEKNLEKIMKYCCKDVVTVARLLQKFKGLVPLADDQVFYRNTEAIVAAQ
jgi:uncharacterized protein YprB with RNaseH-like and TPR domain